MFQALFKKVNTFYERVFYSYGNFLAKHYVAVIAVAFVLNICLSLGSFRMKMVTDSDELFVPMNGEAKADEALIKKLFSKEKLKSDDFFLHQLTDFGTWGELNFLTCLDPATGTYDNILQKNYMEKIKLLNDQLLDQAVLSTDNKTISFESICAKQNGNCLIEGLGLLSPGFYDTQLNDFMRKKDMKLKEQTQMSSHRKTNEFRFYMAGFSITNLDYNLGKTFHVNSYNESQDGRVPAYSRFLKLRYNLEANSMHTIEQVKMWELKFLRTVNDLVANDTALRCGGQEPLRVSYSVSESLNIEMERNVQLDTWLISATFMLIMFFATVLMSLGSTWVTSPGLLLPFAGIMAATFGITSGFGFLSFVGYPGCNLIFVTPFLVFGVGIDDMFIMYSAFKRTYNQEKGEIKVNELIGRTLAKSGIAITITSLTDFTAFMIGLIADFKSVQIFCVYVAFSILFCYLYQLTIFGGFLVIHAKRIQHNHNSVLFCVRQEKLPSFCAPAARAEKTDSDPTKPNNLPFRTLEFLVTRKIGKAIVGLIFLAYLSLSAYGASHLHEGLNLPDLVSDKSYYKRYIQDNTEMLELSPIIMFVVYEPIDYDSLMTRVKLQKFVNNAQKLEHMNKAFSLNWLDNFGDDPLNYKEDPREFLMNLRFFPPFKNDVVIEKVVNNATGRLESQITASRFYLQYEKLYFSSKDAVPMNILRKLCRESGLPVKAYSMPFKFYEQFEQTLPNIIQTFLISTQVMFIIALIFIPDLLSVTLIIVTMLSIMLGLVGSMYFMSLSLSTISMIIIIMAVGFCIDFSAHIIHSFVAETGSGSREERALRAVINVGFPIFNSALSTLVGVSLLFFCESFIFKAFFKTVSTLMVLGVLNALLFLPVLLSIFGPSWTSDKTDENELKGKTKVHFKEPEEQLFLDN